MLSVVTVFSIFHASNARLAVRPMVSAAVEVRRTTLSVHAVSAVFAE